MMSSRWKRRPPVTGFSTSTLRTHIHRALRAYFYIRRTKLNDKLYRNHVNFIKDLLPEAGRGVRGSYTIRFF
jgi:hypothetical protein